MRRVLPLLVACALVAACGSGGGTAAPGSDTGSPPASEPSETQPMPTSDDQAALLDPVRTDAATRTGVPADQVVIQGLVPVTWSDGSLGCPQPGMVYTQAEVNGWQATVVAGGVTLDYRIRGPGQFIVCETPSGG